MACPRLIVLCAATAGMLVAGQAIAQTAGDIRPTIWDAEEQITGDDTNTTAAEDEELVEEIPPPEPGLPRTTLEIDPIEPEPPPPLRPTIEEEGDPYAPLGWRFGGLKALFALEVGANFTDNVQQSETDRISDVGLLIAPKFNIESDWSRHRFTAQGQWRVCALRQ